MKYVVVLYDGMADYPVPALNGKTPMMVAEKPNLDYLAQRAEVGLVRTVAEGLKPGSDVANMSVMGFDPMKYYTGRSPLEAASIGIDMLPTDVSLRCNLVTLSEDDKPYEEKTIEDYCADDISTEEAAEIIKTVEAEFGNDIFKFYPGVSYRHCLIWSNGTTQLGKMTPPHDITGKVITEYLSDSKNAAPLIEMMKKSYDILKNHPVNIGRPLEIGFVFCQDNCLSHIPVFQFIRSGSYRRAEEIRSLHIFPRKQMFGKHRHSHIIQKSNVRRGQPKRNRMIIRHRDFLHILIIGRVLGGIFRIHNRLNRKFHVFCRKRFSVMPGDALLQIKSIRACRLVKLPAFRQSGHNLIFPVVGSQPVK